MDEHHRLTIEGELTADLRELTAEEFAHLAKLTAGSETPGWDLIHRGLALSLVRFGDRSFKTGELAPSGMLEKTITRPRHLMKLRAAWERLHLPDERDALDTKAMRVVSG